VRLQLLWDRLEHPFLLAEVEPVSPLFRQHSKDVLFFDRLLTQGLYLDVVTQDLKNKIFVQILGYKFSFCASEANFIKVFS
jgi:hypothetical protein